MAKRKPRSRRKLTVDLPEDLVRRLKAYSGSADQPVSRVVEESIEARLKGFYFGVRSGDPDCPTGQKSQGRDQARGRDVDAQAETGSDRPKLHAI